MDINRPFIVDEKQRSLLLESMRGPMKYTLMNDFLSKYSLQNDLYALKGLLAALLDVKLDSITDIVILNPIEPGDHIDSRQCILDIKLELNRVKIINLEIQSAFQDFWPERSLTYLCRNFDHLKHGESYDKVKTCIQVGILEHDLFKEDDNRYTGDFCSKYRLRNVISNKEYCSKFEIRVVSLKHVENATDEEKKDPNGLYFWAKLFRAETWEEMCMVAKDNPRMESFVGTIRKLSAEEKVAQVCEERRRYSQDVATYEGRIEAAAKKLEEKVNAIMEKDNELAEKDNELAEKDNELAEKDNELAEKDRIIEELKRKISQNN